MKNLKKTKLMAFLMLGLSFFACSSGSDNGDDNGGGKPDEPKVDMTGYAKGADVSWLTEMESQGKKFYDSKGKETECLTLLRSLGFNSIRLRVWVNPTDKWCGQEDVVAKAVRAKELGMRVMIDFHYSDTWADPGKQYKPEAWKKFTLPQLKQAVEDHTSSVLNALKNKGVTPEWVQVGNEVRSGMLWDADKALSGATWSGQEKGVSFAENQDNFADFIKTGCKAVKSVFPNALVIVHLDQREEENAQQWIGDTEWICDMLKERSVDYDVLGLSFYPKSASQVSDCITNVKNIQTKYGKKVMVCETGMPVNNPSACKSMLASLISGTKNLSYFLGVFYWEPEAYNNKSGQGKEAFDSTGRPTAALDAFAN